MSPEIYWLTLTVVLSTLMVIPYAVYRVGKLGGLWQVFMQPLPGDHPFDDEWAHRAYRAHMNAFEGLALFAPIAIGLHVTGLNNAVTAISASVYFWSRLIYIPMYYFNVPVLRTGIWAVALIANMVMAYYLIT